MVMLQETRLRHLALLSSFVQVASQALLSSSSDCTLVCTGLSNCETPTTCIMVREHFGCECNECSLPCDGGRRLFASSNATEGCTCLGTSCELDCEDLTDWTFSGIYDITCSCERCECATKKPTLEACERIKQSIPYDMDAISRSGCTTATGLTSRGCDKMKVLTMLPMSMDCVDVTLAGVVKIEEEIVVSSHGRVTGGHFDAGGFETRIFRIAAGARLDMTNATLQNGVTTRLAGGGCVLVENFGELLAKRVTFVDCFAAETQGGAVGARLFTYVELELCTITGAIARTFGGGVAVAKDATLRIVASQILNCFSLESGGGVIVFERCRATIIGTEVSNCSAVNSGGGIELQGAQTNITNSQIANCASSFGGGVLVGAATTLLLVASHISRCNAYDSGAAFIVFSLANSAAHLELRDTILDRCSSNRASAAVLWQSTAKVVLSGRTLVAECDSRSSAVITSLEGTLVVGSEANLRNCTSGGGASAIHMYGGHLDFAGEISGNIGQEAGGILGTNEARVTILPGARILHNTAFEGGGAVTVSESATLDVSGPGVRIVGNHAFHGGAFHLDAIHTAFVSGPDVIIAENSAWGNGGAFSTKASRLVIQGSVLLIANYCFGNGGAMAVQRGRLFVSSHSYVWTEWALDFTHAPGHIGGSAAVIYDSETRMPYDADGATMTQNAAPGRRVARYSCLNCKTSYSFDGYSYTSAGWNGGFATAKVLNLESSDMRIEVAEGSHATRVAFSCTGGEGVAKFVGNWANGDGGAAWFSDSSSSFIRGVEFTDNGCLARGSSIFVDFLNTLRATNSTFRSNVGEGSVFVSTLAEAELETIVAQANVGGFLVVDTARNVQLKNVDASENTALTGAGVRIMKTIDVSIKASIFSRNAAEGDGGAIAIIDSDVVLSNTEFNTNSAGAFGGAIASLGSSTLQFRQQDCMLVDFVVDFTQTAASCAPTDPGLDTSALGALTCDFYSMACHELNEYGSCDGCGCFGGPSGFVDIIDRGIVVEPSISSSYFAVTPRANAAHVQSFCLSEGYYSAKAIDGLNTAWGYGGSFAVIIKPERGPLAIHQSNLIGYNGSIAPTNFEVRLNGTSCEAHGNSAGRGGGVTFWDVHEPFWDGLVIKGGNVAAYGAAHATPAVTLRLLSMPSIVTSSSHLVDPTLEVAVYDAHDQIVVSTTSSASVRTNASSSDFLVANDVAPFVNGRAAFPSLVIIGSPGASINLEVESPLATLVRGTAIVRVHVDIRRCLQNEIDESSTCVSCPAGSYLVRDEPTEPGDCIDCPRGADCHSAGNMLSTLHTNKGWWRATAMATTIYKCLPAKACPTRASAMSSTNSTSRACRLGHKGARCGACGGGYYYNYHGVCRKCQRSDRVLAVVFYSALGVIVVLLAYLLVFDHIRVWWRLHDSPKATAGRKGVLSLGGPRRGSDNQATYAMPTTSYLIKARALWSFFQIIYGIPQAIDNVEFPSMYLRLVKIARAAGLNFFHLLPTTCLMSTTNKHIYVTSLVSTTAWPLVLSVFIAVVCCCKTAWANAERKEHLRTYYAQAILLVSHVTLPPTALAASQVFVCSSYDYGRGTKKRFLRIAPAVHCDTTSWRWLLLYAALIQTICVSVPVVYAVLLFSSRRVLNPSHTVNFEHHGLRIRSARHLAKSQSFLREITKSSVHQRQLMAERERFITNQKSRHLRAFQFLWTNLRPMSYYYEVFESVKGRVHNFIVSRIALHIATGSALQITMGYMASLIFALYTLVNHPYVDHNDNLLHTVAQLSASGTLFIIWSLRAGNIGTKQANIWLITIALSPLVFALFTIRSVVCRTLMQNVSSGVTTFSPKIWSFHTVESTPKCFPEWRISTTKSDSAAVAHHERAERLMVTEAIDDCGQCVSTVEVTQPEVTQPPTSAKAKSIA